MKTFYTQFINLLPLCFLLIACENEDNSFSQAATLRVVHTVPDAPPVHVNYFGFDELNFSVNPVLRFGRNQRYTLAANELRDVRFTYSEDTTRQVFNQDVTLDAGQIATLYLVGDSANLSSFMLNDVFQNYRDSLFGVRFVHASDDLEAVSARVIRLNDDGSGDTTSLVSDFAFESASDFITFPAIGQVDDYTFQYLNASDSVLASLTIDPLRSRSEKVFRNIILPIIGRTDDGEGNSSLRVIQIE